MKIGEFRIGAMLGIFRLSSNHFTLIRCSIIISRKIIKKKIFDNTIVTSVRYCVS